MDAGVVHHQAVEILFAVVEVFTEGLDPDTGGIQGGGKLPVCQLRIYLHQKVQTCVLFQNGELVRQGT